MTFTFNLLNAYIQAIFKDPFRKGNNILVMCDAYTPAGNPIPTNNRHNAAKIFSHPKVASEEPWYGIEQEYTLMPKDVNWPIGWHVGGFHGPHYCECQQILQGVNYASAAAGIRDETGAQLGQRITCSGQVENYKNTMSQVVELLGDENTTADYLTICIYTVGMGSNDYLNNYFMLATSRQYSPKQYVEDLIIRYREQLNALYNYGARKFALVGV